MPGDIATANDSFGRGGSPAARTSGRPLPRSAASHSVARSRRGAGPSSDGRRIVRRQRWAGAAPAAREFGSGAPAPVGAAAFSAPPRARDAAGGAAARLRDSSAGPFTRVSLPAMDAAVRPPAGDRAAADPADDSSPSQHVAAEDAVVQPLDHATERALGDVVTGDRGTYSVDAAGGLAQSRRPVPGRAGTDRIVARVAAPTPRVALMLAAAVLILLVLFAAFDSVRPFVLGLVLVYLLAPAVDRLAASGLPRALAVLAVFVGVIAVLVAVATLALSPLIAQLSQFIDDLPSLVGGVRGSVEDFYAGLNLTPDVRAIVDRTLGSFGSGIGGISVGGVVGPIIGSVFGFLATLTAYAILPAWLFFVLRDRVRLADSLERSLPPEWRGDVFAVFAITNRVFGNWIRGQLVLGLIVGLASFVGLMILDRTVS